MCSRMCSQLSLSTSWQNVRQKGRQKLAKSSLQVFPWPLRLTFIEMKVWKGPDYTLMPVWFTSIILPSKTSPCSGMQAMALKLTLKMTSPEVSWMTPSPIFQNLLSVFVLVTHREGGKLAHQNLVADKDSISVHLHEKDDVAVLRLARSNICLLDPKQQRQPLSHV